MFRYSTTLWFFCSSVEVEILINAPSLHPAVVVQCSANFSFEHFCIASLQLKVFVAFIFKFNPFITAGLAPSIPEDLYHMIKKGVSIRKHLEKNRKVGLVAMATIH